MQLASIDYFLVCYYYVRIDNLAFELRFIYFTLDIAHSRERMKPIYLEG